MNLGGYDVHVLAIARKPDGRIAVNVELTPAGGPVPIGNPPADEAAGRNGLEGRQQLVAEVLELAKDVATRRGGDAADWIAQASEFQGSDGQPVRMKDPDRARPKWLATTRRKLRELLEEAEGEPTAELFQREEDVPWRE